MSIEELWQKAISKTEIYRARLRYLYTFDQTTLPYIYMAESALNAGDVVVRQGNIVAERPLVFMPGNMPQLEGFQIDDKNLNIGNDAVASFLFMRGITFPTMKYLNQTIKLDVIPGPLSKAVNRYKKDLEKKEDIDTGLLVSPEDCWQFAVLIYAAALAGKSIPEDVKNILRRMGIQNN